MATTTSITTPIIGDAPDRINTGEHSGAIQCVAYVDTLELFLPRKHRPRLQAFKDLKMMISTCKNRQNQVCGYRCTIHQQNKLTLQKLQQLDFLTRQYQGIIIRSDIAFDFSSPEYEKLQRFIVTHGILKWRPKQPMQNKDEVYYWCALRRNKRRIARNLVLYLHQNKITEEPNNVHFELRLLNSAMIRKSGIHHVSDLINFNPKHLFNRHIKFSDIAVTVANEIARKEANKDRERYRGNSTNDFVDTYRDGIKRRVKSLLKLIQWDRAQIVHDAFPKRKVNPMTVELNIPEILSWRETATIDEAFDKREDVQISDIRGIEIIEESQNGGESALFIIIRSGTQ